MSSSSRTYAEIATTTPPPAPVRTIERAVVLGGSLAGLMAARVLSDHAAEVVLIERDALDAAGGGLRDGVPQGTQLHGLLPSGGLQLERWFPGFTEQVVAAGAVVPRQVRFYDAGGERLTPVADGDALSATRPFLESHVRDRVLSTPGIRRVRGRATEVVTEGGRVRRVRYLPVDGSGAADEQVELTADVVVDAMGRSSRLTDWLAAQGWPTPPLQRLPIRVNYATALFAHDPDVADIDVAIAQTRTTRNQVARQGGVNHVEGGRWQVLIAGYGDDRPTRDLADFRMRARRDFPEVFARIAEGARVLGDVVTYHQADSRRREYRKLPRVPGGLYVVGDALASFNPVYGQGMTSAVLHASALSAHLHAGDPRRAALEYFERAGVVVDAAWQISALGDLSLPHVTGPYPRGHALTAKLGELMFRASGVDAELNRRISRVSTMVEHPDALAAPGTVLRAIRVDLATRLRRR